MNIVNLLIMKTFEEIYQLCEDMKDEELEEKNVNEDGLPLQPWGD